MLILVCSFGQLAAMVSEQSEMIQRIDANTYVPPPLLR
jgi:predicted outer membrane lipoprotein